MSQSKINKEEEDAKFYKSLKEFCDEWKDYYEKREKENDTLSKKIDKPNKLK